MREIPIKQAQSILKRLLKGKNDQQVTMLTKKKDRSLTIAIQGDQVTLVEQGYRDGTDTYQTGSSQAKHEVTTAFKREFPRSHQVYLNQVKE